ncbi:TetR/AcrR family transcriptional regulator [Streptomyces sannanensis]|uniref:TetR/AcrR family transcriptional regulator n=1 Tax=Streptomyces sannanensis TaxID=285536 RepID=A0ABP6SC79_9ACTN
MVTAADRAKQPARTSVWLASRASRGRKSDQPTGLDRDKITAATVRLLDAEGLAKFSMRRLAAELGVTAMSVYWYVDTKDDLLELALDAVMGEMRLPAEDDPADWRDQLRALTTEYRRMLVGHPWVSPLAGEYLNIGPHSLAFVAAIQHVLGRTGLPMSGRTGALAAVFQFVYGFGTVEGRFAQRCAAAGLSQDDYFHQVMGTIAGQPELQETFEEATELMEARGGDTVEEMRERDFVFALDLLIAGIEAKSAHQV